MANSRRYNLSSLPVWALNVQLIGRAFTSAMLRDVRAELGSLSRDNVNKATDYFWRRCREQVNFPYPPASQPWHPPRRRTGTGRNAIKKRFGTRGTPSGWVYVSEGDGSYMADHDVGDVPNVLPRPWLGSTFYLYESRIRNILLTGRPR